MKVLVDVNDNKRDFIVELLNNFSFTKAKSISPAKAQLLEELKEAVENLNLVNQGKIKARPGLCGFAISAFRFWICNPYYIRQIQYLKGANCKSAPAWLS